MTTDNLTPDGIVNFPDGEGPKTLQQAKNLVQNVAEGVCADIERKEGIRPGWRWVGDRQLEIVDDKGNPIVTLNVDYNQ